MKLAAAFVVEGVVWAFPSSFGTLLSAYLQESNLTAQSGASDILPLIGPISSGIMYCSGNPIEYLITFKIAG